MKEVALKLNHPFSDWELDNHWLELFDSADCKVTKKDGGYWLTACRFEKLEDNKVLESANNLITMMTAIAKIEHGYDFQSFIREKKVADSYVERFGNDAKVVANEEARIVGLEKNTVQELDKDGNPIPKNQERQERWYDFYVCQCDDWIDNTVMFKALEYFAKENEPRRLRLIYETIRKDEGGKNAVLNNQWFDKAKLDEFWDFIHYHDLGGLELHAIPKTNPPTINLEAARTFVANDLLKNWLIKKRGSYSWHFKNPT